VAVRGPLEIGSRDEAFLNDAFSGVSVLNVQESRRNLRAIEIVCSVESVPLIVIGWPLDPSKTHSSVPSRDTVRVCVLGEESALAVNVHGTPP
jgi:hypothetical protein